MTYIRRLHNITTTVLGNTTTAKQSDFLTRNDASTTISDVFVLSLQLTNNHVDDIWLDMSNCLLLNVKMTSLNREDVFHTRLASYSAVKDHVYVSWFDHSDMLQICFRFVSNLFQIWTHWTGGVPGTRPHPPQTNNWPLAHMNEMKILAYLLMLPLLIWITKYGSHFI